MRLNRRKPLLFVAQFVPLFLLFLWIYTLVLPAYQAVVFATANVITTRLATPSMIEVRDGEDTWDSFLLETDGGRKHLRSWYGYLSHLMFLSLALLPALLLATPTTLANRMRLLGLALLLLFATHVFSVIGVVRGTYCLRVTPGHFLCLWMLRLVYTSGQLFGVLLWGLLTWRYWFGRRESRAAT